jgi:outer membrane lipoprotein-sorting protein
MRHSLSFLFATLLLFAAYAAPAKTSVKSAKAPAKTKAKGTSSSREVLAVLKTYRTASAITAKVHKTVTQEALGTEVKSDGEFFFSKGRLRLEIREPERSLLVFDGKTIWFETPIDEDRVHVTKMRANELRKADSLLTALFDGQDWLKSFKLVSAKSQDGVKVFVFEAKDKKNEVQRLEIALKSKDVQRITYKDQVENRVTLEFSQLTKGKVPAEKFAYKIPKKAELVEM